MKDISGETENNNKPNTHNNMPGSLYEYDMNHQNRGVAIIFSHKTFLMNSLNTRLDIYILVKNTWKNLKIFYISCRHGTDIDCELLSNSLKNLGFDVREKKDLQLNEMEKVVKEGKNIQWTN